jgi:hypothetical protein
VRGQKKKKRICGIEERKGDLIPRNEKLELRLRLRLRPRPRPIKINLERRREH